MQKITLFWFRRDLRLNDNHALFEALNKHQNVLPLFIFDSEILSKLSDKKDRRVEFIHQTIAGLKSDLESIDSTILIKKGKPISVWKKLIKEYDIDAVYFNRDYEPYAKSRDQEISELLEQSNIPVFSFKDHVIFEGNEILKDDGKPYTVFTPYSKKWKAAIDERSYLEFDAKSIRNNYIKTSPLPSVSIEDLGFKYAGKPFPTANIDEELIARYGQNRNFPGFKSTSRLGIHFRFGTVSIREWAKKASALSEVYLNELIWRDFYQSVLWHFPKVTEKAFKPNYDFIEWRNDEEEFEKWCNGQTGYPIVDAGLRELNETGFMHNRVRMITASFLTKHLLIDWRWGEAYFAEKLLDFDLASNNGGWQWAAGCGTDAAPYFRIFNPYIQTDKFDKDRSYISKWVPEFNSENYPEPIVDHKFARERCLSVYKEGLEKAKS